VPKRLTGLVLQGGGALGAYEYGVLKALHSRPDFQPDVVTGVSIGAINAAVLVGARGEPMESLGELWRRLTAVDIPFLPHVLERSLSALGHRGMYRLRADLLWAPMAATSFYDTAPLRALLRDLVSLDKLNQSPIRIVVTAVNVTDGRLEEFGNGGATPGGLRYDHVVASASLPPGFPMTQIDGSLYWDGGLFSNTPLSAAINQLERLAEDEPDAELELIVVELFPRNSKAPSNLMDVLDRMMELSFADKLRVDEKFFARTSSFIDFVADVSSLMARCETPDQAPETRSIVERLKESDAYKSLKRHRRVDRLTVITNAEPEAISGPTDFTREAIDRRIAAGYRDASRQLGERGWFEDRP
jgi:NTE family protein